MMAGYSHTKVTGYKSHLPGLLVKLPLKYPPAVSNNTASDIFSDNVSVVGELFNLKKRFNSFVELLSFEVSSDLKTINLVPINIYENKLGLKYQKIQISLPHPISGSGCVGVTLDSSSEVDEKNSGQGDPFLVIDLIDENYLFTTLHIKLSDFVMSKHNRLRLDNFKSWGNISVPYSFELRSSPFFLKSIDPYNLIVSLKDGGLLHFHRGNLLSDFDVYNFTETSPFFSFSLSGLLGSSNHVPEKSASGVSESSIVDLLLIHSTIILTLSITKEINFWDLRRHEQMTTPQVLSKNNQSKSWLPIIPAKYLDLFEDESSGKKYLSLPLEAISNSESENISGVNFKLWEVITCSSTAELVELASPTFYPEVAPAPMLDQSQIRNHWQVQDYEVEFLNNDIKYLVLWKSNTSSVVSSYVTEFQSGNILSKTSTSSNDYLDSSDVSPRHDVGYYRHKILNSGVYDEFTVLTSLNIFREHADLTPQRGESLRYSVKETLKTISQKEKAGDRAFWFKLDSLCREFKRLSGEVLSLASVGESLTITLHVNAAGLVRPSHLYEDFRLNEAQTQLSYLFGHIGKILSPKVFNNLGEHVQKLGNSFTEEKSAELFAKNINGKIDSLEIKGIVNRLMTIPNVLNTIESVIKVTSCARTFEDSDILFSDKLEPFNKLFTIGSFKDIKNGHHYILLNLLILLLLCEPNKQITYFIREIISKLSTYNFVESIFDSCFDPNDTKNSSLNKLEFSLLWPTMVDKHHILYTHIRSLRIIEAYDYLSDAILAKDENYILDVCVELIRQGNGRLIEATFFDRTKEDNAIQKFLIGFVHLINNEPTKLYDTFKNYQTFQENYLAIKEKLNRAFEYDTRLGPFFESIFSDQDEKTRRVSYYHGLSVLCQSQVMYIKQNVNKVSNFVITEGNQQTVEDEFNEIVILFEQEALKSLKSQDIVNDSYWRKVSEYNLNIFEIALSLSKYSLVYDSLINLEPIESFKTEYRKLVFRFVSHMVSYRAISELFYADPQQLYKRNYLLIDSIILELANGELTLSRSLRCYEFLYSWRLFGASETLDSKHIGDKRGAVEALYMFITRFKFEQKNLLENTPSIFEDVKEYKLKILELYLVMLNCLKSFESDKDKWIIKSNGSGGLSILPLEGIILEYNEWLKELEHDSMDVM